jgi:hypothetical protein
VSEPQTTRDDLENVVVNLNRESKEVVQAEMVRINQSAIQEVTAEETGLTMSASFNIKAINVDAHESLLVLVDAEKVGMANSNAGIVRADHVDLQGNAGLVLGNSIELGSTYTGFVAGREVQAKKIESIVFLGRHVEGDIQTVVGTRGALIAGMVGGLFAGLIVLAGQFMFPRK